MELMEFLNSIETDDNRENINKLKEIILKEQYERELLLACHSLLNQQINARYVSDPTLTKANYLGESITRIELYKIIQKYLKPQKQETWKEITTDTQDFYCQCPACKETYNYFEFPDFKEYKYCPKCGKKVGK